MSYTGSGRYVPDTPRRTRRHWSKLPPVSHGFTRVPDAPDGTRQLRCDACDKVIPSLGVGYHRGNDNARPCTERTPS